MGAAVLRGIIKNAGRPPVGTTRAAAAARRVSWDGMGGHRARHPQLSSSLTMAMASSSLACATVTSFSARGSVSSHSYMQRAACVVRVRLVLVLG